MNAIITDAIAGGAVSKATQPATLCHHPFKLPILRSPRCRLEGLVILSRMFDKGRATAIGKQGEYHYNCLLDQHLLNYLGLDPDALMAEIKAGKGDGELLEWVLANAKHNRAAREIDRWSRFQDKRGQDGDA
jgi:hypothetical protein